MDSLIWSTKHRDAFSGDIGPSARVPGGAKVSKIFLMIMSEDLFVEELQEPFTLSKALIPGISTYVPDSEYITFLPARRAQSTRLAGTKIALCSRVCVCVCVCSSAIITCAKLHYSVTMPL